MEANEWTIEKVKKKKENYNRIENYIIVLFAIGFIISIILITLDAVGKVKNTYGYIIFFVILIILFLIPYILSIIKSKGGFSIPTNWEIVYYLNNILVSVIRKDIKDMQEADKEREKIAENVWELNDILWNIIDKLESYDDVLLFDRWKIEYLKNLVQILSSLEQFNGWGASDQNNISNFIQSLIIRSTDPNIPHLYDQDYLNLIKEMALKVQLVKEKKSFIERVKDIPKRFSEFLKKRTIFSSMVSVILFSIVVYILVYIIIIILEKYTNLQISSLTPIEISGIITAFLVTAGIALYSARKSS